MTRVAAVLARASFVGVGLAGRCGLASGRWAHAGGRVWARLAGRPASPIIMGISEPVRRFAGNAPDAPNSICLVVRCRPGEPD